MKRSATVEGWEDEAAAIIEHCCPEMIVLDLDFTIWPTFFAEHTLPPYVCLDAVPEEYPSTVLCVDRSTRKPRTLSLYSCVRSTISWCLQRGIRLSVCSRSSNYHGAEAILKCLGMWNVFECPQIYSGRKTLHFRNLRGCTNIPYSDILFFDDDQRNIKVCGGIGVTCTLVNRSIGFDGWTLLEGLKQHARAKACNYTPCSWEIHALKKAKSVEEDDTLSDDSESSDDTRSRDFTFHRCATV
mmetsp:Transcript_9117/g.13724  ORF Transcript_9117/g.13724 Transcript_9117/m.13724 type:complete len:242 (+) Transcript_9117:65-790(+)